MTGSGAQFAQVEAGGRSLRIEYAWIGAASPGAPLLVFLHEGLGSRAMWREFPQQLCAASGVRGLVYSRAGYGCSTPRAPNERWPVEFLHREAYDVLPALFEVLGVRTPPWLFGHSDGGSIALLYAARFPDRVAGLVAVAPHLFVEACTVRSIEAVRATYLATGLKARLARYHDEPDSAFWGWNDVWLDPAFLNWNIEHEVRSIRVPMLAVQGEDDEYGTMAQIERMALAAPHTRLCRLPGSGHSPHRDEPAALIGAVADFLAQHGSVPAPYRAAAVRV